MCIAVHSWLLFHLLESGVPLPKQSPTVRLLLTVVETNPIAGGQERSPSCNKGFPREVLNAGQIGEREFQELKIWSNPKQIPGHQDPQQNGGWAKIGG